jgi:PAS domain S-box-containing protein
MIMMEALLDHAPCGFIIFDDDGNILESNSTLLDMLGYTPGALQGWNIEKLLPPAGRFFYHTYLLPRLQLAGTLSEAFLTLRAADGAELPVLMNAVRRERAGLYTYDAVLFLIRERGHFEDELLKARRAAEAAERAAEASRNEAERANHAKSTFLASMSHELRTPLNAILGRTEALNEEIYGPVTEKQRAALHSIDASGRHLLALVNDILDVAKIEAGSSTLEFEDVIVADLCRSSIQMLGQLALTKRIGLTTTLDSAVERIRADGRRLKQILVNLLSNAVKFTPAGGKIGLEVSGDAERQSATFTVWDTGIGIATDDIPRLFQPFVQIDSSLGRRYEGTGLGLALVLRLAEAHGGSAGVESTPGQGSRFSVTLPWVPSGPPAPALDRPAAVAAHERHTSPATSAPILLAEDNVVSSDMLQDYLQNHGYQVLVARDGLDAVMQTQAAKPALILMDIQMPGMDGLEAIQRIRADTDLSATPIIALTALAMPGDRERCLQAGADDYLAKPVRLRELLATIATYLAPNG